jgi:hypothetical protein
MIICTNKACKGGVTVLFIRFILRSGFIISWLSLIFVRKHAIKKYTPVAILASFLVTIVYEIAYKYGWWKLKHMLAPWMMITNFAFVLGPFFIGTIWVFQLSYRFGFFVYLLVNMALDAFFSFVFLPFLEKTRMVTLKKITREGIYGLMILIAVLIYPYQKWQDSNFSATISEES